MVGTRKFSGRCHCGNIEVIFETEKSPEQLGVRACMCAFCTRHGARTTTDPQGSARITVRDSAKLNRYRFGLRITDFLVCAECGVYPGAIFADGGRLYATLNINTFDERQSFPEESLPASYDHETETERRERRKAAWTPVAVFKVTDNA
jgi:hypothetical protein